MKNRTPQHALLLALSDIKIAHSVFAMPFALLAAFLATPAFQRPRSPTAERESPFFFGFQLVLIVLCMIFARTWAMLVNRIADRRFDRSNQRTAGRAIASGSLSTTSAAAIAFTVAAAFIASCSGFWLACKNPWPLILSIPVLAWIALYSYTKRWTWACHLFLGSALAASPIASAIAINPSILLSFLPPASTGPAFHPAALCILLLSAFVLFWVAGFDIAYAMQDIDFDRRTSLHSIPARLGPRGALWAARLLHVVACTFLFLAARTEPRLGLVFAAAASAVAILLIFEHVVLARRGVAGLPLAFFTLNGVVSCLLGTAGIIDTLI